MKRKRVLYVLHNHPALAHGGSEAYTMHLYEALRDSPEFEPMILARAARAAEASPPEGSRAAFAQVGGDPNQALLMIEDDQYDKLFMRTRDKSVVTHDLEDFLRSRRPDVVHIQHLLFLGCDVISAVRRTLPDTPIVYTLHDYMPICNHYGQLIRTNGELCLEASPRRCNECFPEFSPQTFFLRERLIKAHFANVDLFIAPSEFLLERYVAWGLGRDRIRLEEHGFPRVERRPSPPRAARNRFAFFGVLTPFKGIDVMLRAMELLGQSFDGHLWVHGSNYEDQPAALREELQRLFAATRATVTHTGPYEHADLPELMAETDWVVVPSIWWENAPLVIQESFQHGRPVICSNIGGMAEKVRDGVSGLHFNVGDPMTLADTIRAAAGTAGLWDRLAAGIPPVISIEAHVSALAEVYRDLLDRRRGTGISARAPAAEG